MAGGRRIIVRGKPNIDVDPLVLLQILLTIGEEWESQPPEPSADVFNAAIEDRQAGMKRRAS